MRRKTAAVLEQIAGTVVPTLPNMRPGAVLIPTYSLTLAQPDWRRVQVAVLDREVRDGNILSAIMGGADEAEEAAHRGDAIPLQTYWGAAQRECKEEVCHRPERPQVIFSEPDVRYISRRRRNGFDGKEYVSVQLMITNKASLSVNPDTDWQNDLRPPRLAWVEAGRLPHLPCGQGSYIAERIRDSHNIRRYAG